MADRAYFEGMKLGMGLPPTTKPIIDRKPTKFAGASRDFDTRASAGQIVSTSRRATVSVSSP